MLLLLFSLVFACSSQKAEKECVDPPKSVVPKTLRSLGEGGPKKKPVNKAKADWCRACVMGPKGWASCMKVFAEKQDEARDRTKQRAKEKACIDSGYEKDQCPQKAVIALTCKGDPPPKGTTTPAKALQQLYYGSKGKVDIKVTEPNKK